MIDLHVHTNVSDGSTSIEETIGMAIEAGVTHLAITDHDTSLGWEQAKDSPVPGIRLIPGIELSAFDSKRGQRVHILGYGFDPQCEKLKCLNDIMRQRRNEASIKLFSRLTNLGYMITWQQVCDLASNSITVFKQHFLHALTLSGYTDSIFCELGDDLFFKARQSKVYVPIEYLDAKEAVMAVVAAGGIAVLAHPGIYNNWDGIAELISCGLEGIEVFHSEHDDTMTKKALWYAANHNLVVTAGSDFHGNYGRFPVKMGYMNQYLKTLRDHPVLRRYFLDSDR